jgi:glycosyltransferase involved in cell wall biosynthesis
LSAPVSDNNSIAAADSVLGIEISFFIPCYNEAENVVGAIENVFAASKASGRSAEVLVFDDASTDGTSAVVRSWQAAHPEMPVRLFSLTKNRGVARNFVEGAFSGSGTYYRLVCGDNIEPQATHEALLRAMGSADIIVPYFTEIHNRPWRRKVISRVYTLLVNLASGYRLHYYNGCPIYRRDDVMRYHVESTGFGYQAEFLTRLIYENRSFKEVPLVAYDREGSTSINVKNLLSVGHSLFSIAMRRLRIVLFE